MQQDVHITMITLPSYSGRLINWTVGRRTDAGVSPLLLLHWTSPRPASRTVCSVLLLLCGLDQYRLHHDTSGCSVCRTADCQQFSISELTSAAVAALSCGFSLRMAAAYAGECSLHRTVSCSSWAATCPSSSRVIPYAGDRPTHTRRGGCLQLAHTRWL